MADTTIQPPHPAEAAADVAANGADQIPFQGDLPGTGMKRPKEEDEGEGDGDENGRKERRKIQIKFIEDKSRRHITFSKRKAGIMKKAYELSVLTGTQVLLIVVSETGLVYTFTTRKLHPLVTKPEGKNLIQACLNAPDPEAEAVGVPVDIQNLPPESAADANGVSGQPVMSRPGNVLPYMPSDAQHLAYLQAQQMQQAQQAAQYGNVQNPSPMAQGHGSG